MKPPKIVRNKGLRAKVLERDEGRCCQCGRFDPRWEADHAVALWEGGKDTLENLQTLCRRCHSGKSKSDAPVRAKTDRLRAKAELTERRRRIAGIDTSGAPFVGKDWIE